MKPAKRAWKTIQITGIPRLFAMLCTLFTMQECVKTATLFYGVCSSPTSSTDNAKVCDAAKKPTLRLPCHLLKIYWQSLGPPRDCTPNLYTPMRPKTSAAFCTPPKGAPNFVFFFLLSIFLMVAKPDFQAFNVGLILYMHSLGNL